MMCVHMSEIAKCHKCGCTDKKLIHHHRSYEPEDIVLLCISCHLKLHKKLRRENRCTIPRDTLRTISNASKHQRMLNRMYQKEHYKSHRVDFNFTETMIQNVQHIERITIWDMGDKITCWFGFQTSVGSLLYINLK